MITNGLTGELGESALSSSFLSWMRPIKRLVRAKNDGYIDSMVVKRRSKRQNEPGLEIFHVRYNNGEKDYVRAFTIRFPMKDAERIKFFKSENVEDEEIFVRASEV